MRRNLPSRLILASLASFWVGGLIADEPDAVSSGERSTRTTRPEFPDSEFSDSEFSDSEFSDSEFSDSGPEEVRLDDTESERESAVSDSSVGFIFDDELLQFCDSGGMVEQPESMMPLHERTSEGSHGALSSKHSRKSWGAWSGRFYDALTAALCECDACYQPQWRLLESASFWVDSARPQNRTRVRWDYGPGMIFPDRAEYFWARVGSRGPATVPTPDLDYHELSQYIETAHGGFSAFFVMPYRSLYMRDAGHAAGFGDIQIGTKSLLHDTPLVQVTLQMTTTIPSANSRKGLGTGHVSLEPALLVGLALTERDFLQAQAAEWIPLGGDSDYQGALLRWGVAWNRTVWQRDRDNTMTANLDLVGWSFQDGAYTDPVLGQQRANDESYVYLGPGSRMLLCGRFEFGAGAIFALTDNHFARHVFRSDLTIRY